MSTDPVRLKQSVTLLLLLLAYDEHDDDHAARLGAVDIKTTIEDTPAVVTIAEHSCNRSPNFSIRILFFRSF